MNKIKVALLVFILVTILDIVGVIFEIQALIYVFKPLILLSLLALYVASVSSINKWYVLALIFSFFGDVFLIFTGEFYFIFGLISFLLAHLIFIKIVIKSIKNTSLTKIVFSIIPFLIVFGSLLFVLKDSIGEMLIPVIIYGLAISSFGAVSLINYVSSKSAKTLLMLLGSIVFIISDSVLAINKFYLEAHIFKVIIMITYVLAQYFIGLRIGSKTLHF